MAMMTAETVLAVLAGLSLAGAAGFRVFVPLLVAGLAVRSGHLSVTPEMAWIATTPALLSLGVATVLEAGAVHVPWLDHLLDAVAWPAATVAGAVLAAGFAVDVSPWLRWTLMAVAGGGLAAGAHGGMAVVRAGSTMLTGGLGNPAVTAVETGASVVASVLAVLVPVLAALGLIGAAAFVVHVAGRLRRRRATADAT